MNVICWVRNNLFLRLHPLPSTSPPHHLFLGARRSPNIFDHNMLGDTDMKRRGIGTVLVITPGGSVGAADAFDRCTEQNRRKAVTQSHGATGGRTPPRLAGPPADPDSSEIAWRTGH